MEYFWFVLAALGAGIGTGLAGLSAATVMSFAVGLLCLMVVYDLVWYRLAAAALITAVGGAFAELLSHGGNDTVTVPAANIVLLALLVLL